MAQSKNTDATINERINFGKTKQRAPYPDFLDIQLQSFREFFQIETTPENRKKEGLYNVLRKLSYF